MQLILKIQAISSACFMLIVAVYFVRLRKRCSARITTVCLEFLQVFYLEYTEKENCVERADPMKSSDEIHILRRDRHLIITCEYILFPLAGRSLLSLWAKLYVYLWYAVSDVCIRFLRCIEQTGRLLLFTDNFQCMNDFVGAGFSKIRASRWKS